MLSDERLEKGTSQGFECIFSGLYSDNSPAAKYPLMGAIKSDEMIALS